MYFLVLDKFCFYLLGRDLIEKLNLFPGIKNSMLNSFKNIVENYKIDNFKPIKNTVAKLYPKPEHSPSFLKARTVHFSYEPKVEEAINKLVEFQTL